MASKIDNAAIQDGYSLYHHVILFDKNWNWAIIQQGMNQANRMARRYHWISDKVKSFILEPHSAIISNYKGSNVLNMTSINSKDNQRICVDLATSNINNLLSSVSKVTCLLTPRVRNTLDTWLISENLVSNNGQIDNHNLIEHYEMPRKLDWNLFRRIYDVQPQDYEELLSISGVGPATVRSLSLIGELIYGTRAS